MAMIRLSPEKRHSGARVEGVRGTPPLADGRLSGPPTSSSATLPGGLSPGGLRAPVICSLRSGSEGARIVS